MAIQFKNKKADTGNNVYHYLSGASQTDALAVGQVNQLHYSRLIDGTNTALSAKTQMHIGDIVKFDRMKDDGTGTLRPAIFAEGKINQINDEFAVVMINLLDDIAIWNAQESYPPTQIVLGEDGVQYHRPSTAGWSTIGTAPTNGGDNWNLWGVGNSTQAVLLSDYIQTEVGSTQRIIVKSYYSMITSQDLFSYFVIAEDGQIYNNDYYTIENTYVIPYIDGRPSAVILGVSLDDNIYLTVNYGMDLLSFGYGFGASKFAKDKDGNIVLVQSLVIREDNTFAWIGQSLSDDTTCTDINILQENNITLCYHNIPIQKYTTNADAAVTFENTDISEVSGIYFKITYNDISNNIYDGISVKDGAIYTIQTLQDTSNNKYLKVTKL